MQQLSNLQQTYSVSQKNPPLWQFFQNGWEFFNQILHAYYTFLSTLNYEFLLNYVSATLTKLCHIKRDHPVHIMCAKCPPSAETHFQTFFPNSYEFLVQILPAYYTFLCTLDYKFLFNYLQL